MLNALCRTILELALSVLRAWGGGGGPDSRRRGYTDAGAAKDAQAGVEPANDAAARVVKNIESKKTRATRRIRATETFYVT